MIQLWCDMSQQTFVSYISKKYLIDADITAIKFPVIVIAWAVDQSCICHPDTLYLWCNVTVVWELQCALSGVCYITEEHFSSTANIWFTFQPKIPQSTNGFSIGVGCIDLMILLRIQISFSCRRRLNKPWILNRASNFLAACAVWSRKEIHGIGLSRLRRQKVFEYT